MNDSWINKPMWVFAGAGHDMVYGDLGNDPLPNVDDDGAVAPHEWTETESGPGDPPGENLGKVALLPGETAVFNNYTSYSRGINGVMIDVEGLGGTPDIDDFEFYVGNDSDPDSWSSADDPASITLRTGAGTNGSDRVTIIWTDNDIRGEWLQVRMLATATTNLASDEVFYLGNAPAEAGNSTADAKVTTADLLLARNNPRNFLNPAEIDFGVDFNRDKNVDATDVLLARNNQTNFLTALNLISVPAAEIEILRFYTEPGPEGDRLKVDYRISGGYTSENPAPEFDVNIYSSPDGVVPETQLIATETVSLASMLDDDEHTVDISPVFTDPEEDYYLMAVVQADVDVAGNNFLFEGGIFLDDYNDIVHVHGRDVEDEDKQDLVDLDVVVNELGPNGPYTVTLGEETPRAFASGDVAQFHIRTHAGNDEVTTPYDTEINDSGINKTMWVFAGAGDDAVSGGDLADLLYGGPGDDALSGRAGSDTIYGEDGHDELEGHDGADTMEGGPGNDRLEGWGDGDYLYGGPGDDVIVGGQIEQGMGTDHDDAADYIYGGDGNDWIDGRFGGDIIYGDDRNVHEGQAGTEPGNDEIYGYDGFDIIFGGPGHDDLFAEEDGGIIIAGDGDDIVNGSPASQYPQVNLVADVDELGDFDAFYGSEDNREENGFFGGKFFHVSGPREEVKIYFDQNDDDPDFDDDTLRLTNSSPDAIDIYTAQTGGTLLSAETDWTINGDMSFSVYVDGQQTGGGELTLSVVETVAGRPLADVLRFIVV